ncbi:MAG: hypothetical protein ACE366_19695 [Bradymonadia bacterium]
MITRLLSPSKGRALAASLSLMTLWGCGGDEDTGPSAPPRFVPELAAATYTAGHIEAAKRGISLDEEDLFAINAGTSITLSEIDQGFGVLVLNRNYLDSPVVEADGNPCNLGDRTAEARPLARSEAIIESLTRAGLTFDTVAVNVDLMRPDRGGLMWECFEAGAQSPRFGRTEHRENIIAMFEELAGLDNIAYITVGVGMNQYFHQSGEDGSLKDDYSNFMSLYREVYSAIKARNANIKVGPGISWTWFMGTTVPEITRELEALYPDEEISELEAVYVAWQRTIAPLLRVPDGPGSDTNIAFADYLGVNLVPFTNQAPFQGNPAPEDNDAVISHYSYLSLAADGLPIAVPQIDWTSEGRSGVNRKGPFLETVKAAISHVPLEFMAWRRFADLDVTELPGRSSICETFTDRGFPRSLCFSGMLGASADERSPDVLDIFLTDP